MESIINSVWQSLYTHNSKIQAFAVCKDSEVIWQTSNWNPAAKISELLNAVEAAASSVEIDGTKYSRISSNKESYIASADKDQGHFLMALADTNLWVMAWATHDSIPELTIIDLLKSAFDLHRLL